MNVLDGALELVLRLVCRVVRELRLVGTDEVGGGVDDRAVEMEDRRGFSADADGEALDLRIEPDAHQRIVLLPGTPELLRKGGHATFGGEASARFFRCTSRIETAAGVTPGTRAAWPSVAGRTSLSRWRTSWESPVRRA